MIKSPGSRKNRKRLLLISFRIALGALIAYWLGFRFTALFLGYLPKIGGLWSSISAVVVIQESLKDTRSSALLRLFATAIGALVSAIYLSLWEYHEIGMALTILASSLICTAFKAIGWMRLSAITVLVVMVTASLNPALNSELNALLRFIESCIGAVVAYVLVALWPKS